MPSRCQGRGCRSPRVRRSPSPYSCLYRSISCFVLLLILGLVGFIVGMVNYFVPPIEHRITASPLDTRLLPFSPSDCGDLEVALLDSSNSSQLQVDLYLLSQKPDKDLGAIIHEFRDFDLNPYQATELYYHYYLVSKSSIQIKIAFKEEAIEGDIRLTIYVQSNEKYFCYFTYQVLDCTKIINIEKDSLYDITLQFSGTSPAASGSIEIIINKYIYKTKGTITMQHCSAPCSREINQYNEHALVTTSNMTETVTWSDTVGYKWTCSNMRSVGLWVNLVMLLGMLVMMVSIGFIVGLSVVLCIKKRTQNEETEPLIPQTSDSPLPNLVEPPPQYTVSASNPLLSLANPPPYTESTDQQAEGATPK